MASFPGKVQKAILCDKELYWLELSAYVHLIRFGSRPRKDPSDYVWRQLRSLIQVPFGEIFRTPSYLLSQCLVEPTRSEKPLQTVSLKIAWVRDTEYDLYAVKEQRLLGDDNLLSGSIGGGKGRNSTFSMRSPLSELVSCVSSTLRVARRNSLQLFTESQRRLGPGLGSISGARNGKISDVRM